MEGRGVFGGDEKLVLHGDAVTSFGEVDVFEFFETVEVPTDLAVTPVGVFA